MDGCMPRRRHRQENLAGRHHHRSQEAYASTGAPQIAGNVVVIGNAGADMGHGAVRGYVSAYDLDTGAFKWRFFTVPPAVGQPLESPDLAAAAKTWDSTRDKQFKLGGTAWDGFAYDPALNLVYFGTANAAPYDLRQLGNGKLDSLYTATILALHADTGRLAWYYQTTPHDSWDYDAVQKMILTDLDVGGETHSVILQANKNGFFYVIDRKTGKLLSAKNFTYVNWASGIDMKTGRPILTSQSDWYASPKVVYPSWGGGHTWNPMSLSAQTHLVYIPVLDTPAVWVDMAHNGGDVKYLDGFFTANGLIPDDTYNAADVKRLYGPLPTSRTSKPRARRRRCVNSSAPGTRWRRRPYGNMKPRPASAVTTAASCPPPAIWCFRAAAAAAYGSTRPTRARCSKWCPPPATSWPRP
jgi:quinohemoprotein ethanol dehydrogenase